ncbi:hypothetical protein [Pseudoalteromonas luteoviolacea]|uniref:DUF58 domain-containing protein n=1 Tax=Pseudoalteromonas luteoviolacea S4054 TaxID=1129367 RepID=A0A0F6A9I4_9GAMM|nr:hypothetical protein [Pseudoalteromonas luteoviolacea]AOT10702.1 hypothetical protein S4054249_22870 [Pseudoalteromonas luteoviolacea]AOT16136.1 hypothetical protein S40542_25640 [Pseudoalteromonas luteoviolacea]AOT20522.1 hypothetical protein S4054_22785 [Pseudoalteromonas luteoviolacea]KKE82074.1 hypothetical protein N479_20195 [Pseudoalteromonas luteoviolacea S4054]KZN67707.1 hypothetical protein N481_23720 [Pseudoalteromonas luteoviolacea S4047-1]
MEQITRSSEHRKLSRALDSIKKRLYHYLAKIDIPYTHPAYAVKIGEFKSPRFASEGIEWSNMRGFELGDNVNQISKRSLQYFACGKDSARTAIQLDHVHINQWQQYSEKQLVVVLDASRSILAGLFSEKGIPTKLDNYFYTLTNLLSIAYAKKFKLSIVISSDNQCFELKCESKAGFFYQVLEKLQHIWFYSLGKIAKNEKEGFSLSAGLDYTLSLKNKALVVCISDFLDPIDDYRKALSLVFDKHHCILANISTHHERIYPVPSFFHFTYTSIPRWESARYLEHTSSEPVCNTKSSIKRWNKVQKHSIEELTKLVKAHNTTVYDFNLGNENEVFKLLCQSLSEVE